MKLRILIFAILNFSAIPLFSQGKSLNSVDYSFYTSDGKYKLNGHLKRPQQERNNGKCIILVSPPFAIDKHYLGYFDKLSDSLCAIGFSIFSFDNRNFTYKQFGFRMSMHIQASDANAALLSLQSNPQFIRFKFGYLGHSEGAAAVSIAMALNKSPDFCILLSPMGLNGDIITNYQTENRINNGSLKFPPEIIKSIIQNNKEIIQIIKEEGDYNKMRKNVSDQFNIFLKKNPKIIEQYKYLVDSINRISSMSLRMKNNNVPLSLDSSTINKVFESIFGNLFNDGQVQFIRYEPEKYFSKIVCPTLILYGALDNLLEPNRNADNIISITNNYKKMYFKVLILESLNHEFINMSFTNRVIHNNSYTYPVSSRIFTEITKWVNDELFK